ncbi:ABC transporter permease [Amycolatopsis sp. NPDC101161]|uniref:ABC transporter permease n=1 Tax=Amycolatopsis sp. NPDC101161 TaxID=3363940 RepID=UPI0037FAB197
MLKTSLRSFLAHKGRLALAGLAVVLGVTFVTGTLVFSDTINSAVTGLFTSTAADVTVSPQQAFTPEVEDQGLAGATPTLPASTVDRVAGLPGVQAAHGQVSVQNLTLVDKTGQPVGPTSGAPTLGQNWVPTAHPSVTMVQGRPPAKAGEIVIDQAGAQRRAVRLGDPLRVITPSGATSATVVGLARFTAANPGVGLALFDTATAQNVFLGQKDTFTAIIVDVAPGAGDATVQHEARTALGTGFTVNTKEEQAASAAAQIGSFLDVVTYALLGFAGIAVLVGIFLILNTFSMLVAQRTRELGLLRALGARRGQVLRAVLLEALLLGVVGSTVGLAAGVGLAALLKSFVGRAGVDLSGTPLVISAPVPIAAYAVGVLVTVLAAWLPARRGARVAPMEALREAAAPASPSLGRRALLGLPLLVAGAAALAGTTAVSDDLTTAAILLGGGVITSLLAAIVLGPLIARVVVNGLGVVFPLVFGTVGKLSQRNAIRNPRRTGATAAALMIGLSMVSAAAVLAASLNTSITREVDSTFGADFVVSAGGAQPISSDVTAKVRAVPGVQTVTRQRYALAHYNGFQIALAGVDTATIDQAVKTQYVAGSTTDLARGGLMVDQTTAATNNLHLGSPVPLTLLGGATATLTVTAISKTPAGGGKDGGTFEVSLDTLARYAPAAADVTLYVTTAPGADKTTVAAALDRTLAGNPQIRVQNQTDYRNQVTGQVTTILTLLYGLLALAILIAILGVINTLTLSVIERTREIGLLRAVGTSRRQIRRLIRLESVLIAVHGALLGVALGLAWGVAGQKALTSQGITALTVPWSTIVAVLAGAVVIGLGAAILPAYRAARMNTLTAIATG